jgi:Ca2+-binding RTX toxin-like protein
VADFNGDGFPDVAVANSSSNDISMLLNDGDGKLQAQTNYKVGTAPDNMVVADFNGDAILDLAVSVDEEGDTSKQNIVILQGNGDGTFEKDSTIDEVDADSLAVEDLNQDGSPDLVVGSRGSTEIAVLFNNSATETTKISGTGKKDKLIGTNDGETIEGLGGNDTLNGKNGDDILDGGKGKDTMDGGKGDDTYFVDNPKDVIKESRKGGTDTVNASINYTLKNNVENLVLTGKKSLNGTGNNGKNEITGNDAKNVIKGKGGNDLLNGEGGSDRLFGDNGKDTLTGGGGNDILDGGKGNDTLTGGGGKDKFVFNTKRRFRSSDVGVDAIEDFILGDDKIVLDRTTFNSLKNNQFRDGREFEIVDTNAAAKNSNAFIVYNEASGDLFYNANGSKGGFGGGGLFASLDSGLDLSADDFTIKK